MNTFEQVLATYNDISALIAAETLLGWDQQVLMPYGGAPARSAHLQILRRMIHEQIASDELANLVEKAFGEVDPSSEAFLSLSALKRTIDTETKIPQDLVERKARVSSEGYLVWKQARQNDDFHAIKPYYRELFSIAKETADCLGYLDHPYDALINLFEFGATTQSAKAVFDTIKEPIIALVREIQQSGNKIDDSFLVRDWEQEKVRQFAEKAVSGLGFDLNGGRLDIAPNAFCSHLSSTDVRMTTRPSDHLKGILSSSLHEMGHGLYEQGSPRAWDGTPLAGGASHAVHESQSRLWENVIGRSLPFWNRFLPEFHRAFPELGSLTVEDIYAAVNKVEPSYIRVGADELTYNLHILIRFELEVDLITGTLEVDDLPEAWNAKYRDYLGIEVPKLSLGCLQDVHWSRGSVGYFPTYTMGNLIGLQIWEKLVADLGEDRAIPADGDFSETLTWLQTHIYQRGRTLTPAQLVTEVTGKPMDSSAWLKYVNTKYRALYKI
jgi:carboxypeptidase Taq